MSVTFVNEMAGLMNGIITILGSPNDNGGNFIVLQLKDAMKQLKYTEAIPVGKLSLPVAMDNISIQQINHMLFI